MSPLVLMILSIAGVVLLFGALAWYLLTLIDVLGRVGGKPTSYLAKIRMGVRAIEVETGHLPVEVTQLNEGLTQVRDGLRQIDANLGALISAVSSQPRP